MHCSRDSSKEQTGSAYQRREPAWADVSNALRDSSHRHGTRPAPSLAELNGTRLRLTSNRSRVTWSTTQRQVVLPNESVLHRVVVPLLLRSVVLPKESVVARVVVPSLCRQVVLPNASVEPRVVEPLPPRMVVLPNESVEARAVVPSLLRIVVLPNVSVLARVVVPSLLRQVVLPKESVEQRVWASAAVGAANKALSAMAKNKRIMVIFP